MRWHRSVLFLLVILPVLARAEPAANPSGSSTPETVALMPWNFVNGTKGTHEICSRYMDETLTKLLIEPLPRARVNAMWLNGLSHSTLDYSKSKGFPPAKELLELGQKLGADWVIIARARWHTRSIWIGLGPKTKSDCYIDMMIIDVKHQTIALNQKQVDMGSDAKDSALKDAGAILLTPLISVVSGGPKTPQEERGAVFAIAKAMKPWVTKLLMVREQKITP
ncbi:MAG: hypothetical protein M1330_00965 [Armatimonadetes bacterium]|nr:hypothetical protein [Armatimonadota bacterium]